MYTISKSFEIDAGHRLVGHKGKCWNLHGHRYKFIFHYKAASLDNLGMVIDFYHLKKIKEWLDKHWDHGMILYVKDKETIEFCNKMVFKHYVLDNEPTAEAMSKFLLELFRHIIKKEKVDLWRVEVHETPTCVGSYTYL